jgi:hypothetical protein
MIFICNNQVTNDEAHDEVFVSTSPLPHFANMMNLSEILGH